MDCIERIEARRAAGLPQELAAIFAFADLASPDDEDDDCSVV